MSETEDILSSAPMGEVTMVNDALQVIFHRRYNRSVEKVWAAITTPERLADWLANAEIEMQVGGAIRLNWFGRSLMVGQVVALDPPHIFAWTWPHDSHPESVVRWELEPEGDGCRLTLTQTGLTGPSLLGVASGWHIHLEGLARAAESIPTPWRAEREREIVKLYESRSPA